MKNFTLDLERIKSLIGDNYSLPKDLTLEDLEFFIDIVDRVNKANEGEVIEVPAFDNSADFIAWAKGNTDVPLKVEEVPERPDESIRGLRFDLFEEGYNDGKNGNVLKKFKRSYRLGFRKAKIEEQQEARRKK